MAERRMFSKIIIDSDAFLDMPLSTQALYFHLSMRADDEGFINNHRKIQRMIGCADDDMKILITKRFILVFESGVIVIKHWKIHNYIRADRLKNTIHQEELAELSKKENGSYTDNTPFLDVPDDSDGQVADICQPNDGIGKVRLGKDRLGKDNKDSRKSRKRVYADDDQYLILARYLFEKILTNGNAKEPNFQTWADDIRKMVELDKRSTEEVRLMIEWSQSDSFWQSNILSAKKLREKYDTMIRQSNRPKKQFNNYKPSARKETIPDWGGVPKVDVAAQNDELERQLRESGRLS